MGPFATPTEPHVSAEVDLQYRRKRGVIRRKRGVIRQPFTQAVQRTICNNAKQLL